MYPRHRTNSLQNFFRCFVTFSSPLLRFCQLVIMTYKKESPIRSIASVPSSIQPQHKPGSRPASPAAPRAAIVIIAVSPLLHSREFGSNTPIPQATAAGTSDVSLNDDGDVSFTDSSRADSGLRVSSSSIANSDSNYDDAFDDDYPSALQDSHEFGQFSFDLIGEDTLRASLATLTPAALTASSDSISNSSDSSEGTTGDLTWDNSDDSLIDSSDSTSAVLGPLPHWWGEEDHGTYFYIALWTLYPVETSVKPTSGYR